MRTSEQLTAWCIGAHRKFGDPSVPVCQCFFEWREADARFAASSTPGLEAHYERAFGRHDGVVVLRLWPDTTVDIPVRTGEPEVDDDGVVAFGAEEITRGVWALRPSLNMPGLLHAFVVLYGVPDPAPWARRFVVPS
ncbi:MAG: hypothetical protein KJ007_03005 [Burkholderiales bacterium]|nr:hypothetical protein [Burkholderiales bacterium]